MQEKTKLQSFYLQHNANFHRHSRLRLSALEKGLLPTGSPSNLPAFALPLTLPSRRDKRDLPRLPSPKNPLLLVRKGPPDHPIRSKSPRSNNPHKTSPKCHRRHLLLSRDHSLRPRPSPWPHPLPVPAVSPLLPPAPGGPALPAFPGPRNIPRPESPLRPRVPLLRLVPDRSVRPVGRAQHRTSEQHRRAR